MQTTADSIPDQLFSIGALCFGNYTLKSGQLSPFYLDLRLIISYPKLLSLICERIAALVSPLQYTTCCGVPYTGIPVATGFALLTETALLMRRKEKKEYGKKQMIEGVWKKGERCLVIEDLITTGKSVLETVKDLEKEGLIVEDIFCLVNRCQGGEERLNKQGYRLHCLYTIKEILAILAESNKICAEEQNAVLQFIEDHS